MASLSVTHTAPFSFSRGHLDARDPETVQTRQFPGAPGSGQPVVEVAIDGTVESRAPSTAGFSASDFGYPEAWLGVGGVSSYHVKGDTVQFPYVENEQGIGAYYLFAGTPSSVPISGSQEVYGDIRPYLGDGQVELEVTGWSTWRQGTGIEAYVAFQLDEGWTYYAHPTTISGTVAVTYTVDAPHAADLAAFTPRLDDTPHEPFGPPPVTLPDGHGLSSPVGTIASADGLVLVTRAADGSVAEAEAGTPLYLNDTVETFDGPAVIDFVGNSTLTIVADARLDIDEYVYDPNDGSGGEAVGFLRSFFIHAGDLIHGQREPVEQAITVYGVGIRGSAEEVIRDDLLNNPAPELGEVGIWVETGSPMTLSTFTTLPDGPVTFTFGYAFLGAGAGLTVSLGGRDIVVVGADEAPLGERQTLTMELEWQEILTSLALTIDGPEAGLAVILTDIWMGEQNLTLRTDWSAHGQGHAEFVYILTKAQLDELTERALAFEPAENEPPVAVDDSATTAFETVVTIDVLANDSDPDGSLVAESVTVTAQGQHGTATANPDGSITYTPNPGATGEDSFRYTVADNDGAVSDEATVQVTIGAPPPPPPPEPIVIAFETALIDQGPLHFRAGLSLEVATSSTARASASLAFDLADGVLQLHHLLDTDPPGGESLVQFENGFFASTSNATATAQLFAAFQPLPALDSLVVDQPVA